MACAAWLLRSIKIRIKAVGIMNLTYLHVISYVGRCVNGPLCDRWCSGCLRYLNIDFHEAAPEAAHNTVY